MTHPEHNTKRKLTLDKYTIGLFFFGVGFTMFLINIITIIDLMKVVPAQTPLTGYYVSIMSSIILMTYSVYNIYDEN